MKKMLRYVLLISVCLGQVGQGVASDTLQVKLKAAFSAKRIILRLTAPVTPSVYANECSGYPACDTSAITVAVLNRDQYWYGLLKEGRRTADEFAKQRKDYAIDTTQLAPRRIKSYVSIFTGLKGAKKIIIVDANNNHNFLDDTAYAFDTLTMERNFREDTLELAPLVRVQYERNTRQGVETTHTYLRLLPYHSAYGYPKDMQRRLAVYVQPQVYREGALLVDGQAFKVSVSSGSAGCVDNYARPAFVFQAKSLDYADRKEASISVGGTMLVDTHTFTALSCTRDGSELTVVAERYDPNRVGGRVRNLVPMLTGKTDEGMAVSINELLAKGNHVLLDFWGSWCGPCIASMPALKELHNRVKTDRIQFVGVDYEYNGEGREKARELEADKQLSWQQVVELSGSQTEASIPKRLGVTTYPTFILLSPEGRILLREVGEAGLVTIKAKLGELGLLTR